MKTIMMLVVTALVVAGCGTVGTLPSPITKSNYHGGVYGDDGQNPHYPYNAPYGGADGCAAGQ